MSSTGSEGAQKIIQEDFLMSKLPKEYFQTVIIDPPYNAPVAARKGGSTVRLKKWIVKAADATWFDNDSLSDEEFQALFLRVFKKCYRASIEGAHLYMFCSRWRLADFEKVLALAGWTVRNWII